MTTYFVNSCVKGTETYNFRTFDIGSRSFVLICYRSFAQIMEYTDFVGRLNAVKLVASPEMISRLDRIEKVLAEQIDHPVFEL